MAQISFEAGDTFRFGTYPYYGVVLSDGNAVMVTSPSGGKHKIEKGPIPEDACPIDESEIGRLKYPIQLALRMTSLSASS